MALDTVSIPGLPGRPRSEMRLKKGALQALGCSGVAELRDDVAAFDTGISKDQIVPMNASSNPLVIPARQ